MGNLLSKTTSHKNETHESQLDLIAAENFDTSRNDIDYAEHHSAPLRYEKHAEGDPSRSAPPFTGRDHQRIFRDPEDEDILRDHKNIFPPDQKLSEKC